MRFIIPLLIVGLMALALATPESLEGKQAPNFSVKDVNGKTISLDGYKGKYVLLNFWASW